MGVLWLRECFKILPFAVMPRAGSSVRAELLVLDRGLGGPKEPHSRVLPLSHHIAVLRTYYVDATYCYRPSSVVCRFVCLSVT